MKNKRELKIYSEKIWGLDLSPKNWHIIKNFDKEKESWKIWTKNKGLSKFRPKNGALDFLPKNGISSKILIKKRSPGKFRPIIGGLPKCRQKRV